MIHFLMNHFYIRLKIVKKTLLITLIFIQISTSFNAQNARSLYFLNDWSQRHTLNASFAPEYGQFSLPLIGGVNMNLSSNAGLSNFIYQTNNQLVTFLNPSVDGHEFLNKLSPNEYFDQGMNLNIFSFGFKTKNAFWSVDCSFSENLNLNIPYDLFRLMKMAHESQTNVFDLKNLSMTQSNFGTLSVGYSRDINSKIRVGVNAKLIVGLSSERIKYNQFDITMANDKFEINAEGESLLMSKILSFGKDQNSYYDFSKPVFDFSFQNPAGIGAGIDLGISYQPIKQLKLAAGINDLGFINWDSKSIKKGVAQTNFNFTGFTIVSLDSIGNISKQLTQLQNDAAKLVQFQEQPAVTQNIIERIPYTFNISAEYSIFDNKDRDIRIGLLWNSYNTPSLQKNELIAAVTMKPFTWFSFSTTYAIVKNDNNRLGLALNFSPKWVNFFLASDFITNKFNKQLLPINKFDINMHAGISFYLGNDQ